MTELERRRDLLLEAFDGWPVIKPGGGWSLLLDVAELGFEPEDASRLLLEEASIAATGMRGWGADVAERHVRFVYSAEPLERSAGSRSASRRALYDAETAAPHSSGATSFTGAAKYQCTPSGSRAEYRRCP